MNELTMVLDKLEQEATNASGEAYRSLRTHHLSSDTINKLVVVLREQGGEMGRLAGVIQGLLAEREEENSMPRPAYSTTPRGNVTVPDGKHNVCTRTAGNGVMASGTT